MPARLLSIPPPPPPPGPAPLRCPRTRHSQLPAKVLPEEARCPPGARAAHPAGGAPVSSGVREEVQAALGLGRLRAWGSGASRGGPRAHFLEALLERTLGLGPLWSILRTARTCGFHPARPWWAQSLKSWRLMAEAVLFPRAGSRSQRRGRGRVAGGWLAQTGPSATSHVSCPEAPLRGLPLQRRRRVLSARPPSPAAAPATGRLPPWPFQEHPPLSWVSE